MLDGLQRDLQPVGQLEQLLVQKIAANYWRLRRLVRFETGAVCCRLDRYIQQEVDRHYQRLAGAAGGESRPILEYFRYGDDVSDEDLERQAALVEQVTRPEWNPVEAAPAGALQGGPIAVNQESHEGAVAADHAGTSIDAIPPSEIESLRQQIAEREQRILAEMHEVRRWSARLDQLARVNSTPGPEVIDKVVKYEAALERSVFRNLDVLLHLQRTRRERDGDPEMQADNADERYAGRENGFELEI
jgi:hypothetical protein